MSIATTLLIFIVGGLIGTLLSRVGGNLFYRIRRSGRLVGLTLISLYEWFVGIFFSLLTAMVVVMIALRYDELRALWAPFKVTPEKMLAELFIVIVLAFMAAIGLWRATAWGWNIAAFAISLAAARNLAIMVFSRHLAPQLGQPEPFYIAQHLIRCLVGLLILVYLFRPRVMLHCGVHDSRLDRIKKIVSGVVSGFALQWLLQRFGN